MSKLILPSLYLFLILSLTINCNHSQSNNEIKNKFINNNVIPDSLNIKIQSNLRNEITVGFTDEFLNQEFLEIGNNRIVGNRIIEDYEGLRQIIFPIPMELKNFSIIEKNSFFQIETGNETLNQKINFEVFFRSENDSIVDPLWQYSKFINNKVPNWWNNHISREKKINEYFINKNTFLLEYAKEHRLDSSFTKIWQSIIKYQKFHIRLNLPMFQKWNINYLKNLTNLKSEYTHEDELSSSYYMTGLINLMLIINFLENGNDMKILNYQKSVVKNFSGKHKDFLLMQLLIKCKDKFRDFSYSKEEYNSFLATFLDICQTPKYKKYIEKSINIPILNQKEALMKLDRSSVLLKDIISNNKYSYVDFWASWCAPCRAEMPDSKKISEKYNGKEIQFVYVSVDENVGAWENAINRIGLPNKDNYFLPNGYNSEIGRKFKITTIPRYMIIDNTGKVIDSDAPRPSDPKLHLIFKELFKKQK